MTKHYGRSILHCSQLKTRGSERGSRSSVGRIGLMHVWLGAGALVPLWTNFLKRIISSTFTLDQPCAGWLFSQLIYVIKNRALCDTINYAIHRFRENWTFEKSWRIPFAALKPYTSLIWRQNGNKWGDQFGQQLNSDEVAGSNSGWDVIMRNSWPSLLEYFYTTPAMCIKQLSV